MHTLSEERSRKKIREINAQASVRVCRTGKMWKNNISPWKIILAN